MYLALLTFIITVYRQNEMQIDKNHGSKTDSRKLLLQTVITQATGNNQKQLNTSQCRHKALMVSRIKYKALEVSSMEDLSKLHLCHERQITFKQAFFCKGMSDENTPLKQLKAQEEFSALVNWALHGLVSDENMILRVREKGLTYQTILHKIDRRIQVGRIKQIYGTGAMRYDWQDEIKYHSLSVSEINASAKRADVINDAITNRQDMMQQQAERPRDERPTEMPNEETPGSSSPQDLLSTIPSIRLRETEPNLWEVVMTEEEKELIAEFLEV